MRANTLALTLGFNTTLQHLHVYLEPGFYACT
jgi:hypothetical protein